MSWTNDVVMEFLELYRREQLLWDPKHPLHRNRTEVMDAWHRIQSNLSIHFAVIDLKKKKESLMTSFRMHLHKKKKSPESYHTSWFAYAVMESFLGGKYECDSTQMEHELFNTPGQYNPQPMLQDQNTTRPMNPIERNTTRPTRPSTQTQLTSTAVVSSPSLEYPYSKKTDDSVPTNYIDEYELYGQLLAKKLRKLDEHQRDVAMHEIDNIMFRAKMQTGNILSRSYSSSPSPVPRKMKSPVFIVAPQNHTQYEDENIPFQEHMQPQPPS